MCVFILGVFSARHLRGVSVYADDPEMSCVFLLVPVGFGVD